MRARARKRDRASGSDEAYFDCGGRGFITRGRPFVKLARGVGDDGRDVPRGQNNTPLVFSPLVLLSFPPSLASSPCVQRGTALVVAITPPDPPSPSLSSWVIRSHRQKGLAVRRLRSSSAPAPTSSSRSSAQVCNKDVI